MHIIFTLETFFLILWVWDLLSGLCNGGSEGVLFFMPFSSGCFLSSFFSLWIFQKFGKEVVFCVVDFLLQVWSILLNEYMDSCVFLCYVPVWSLSSMSRSVERLSWWSGMRTLRVCYGSWSFTVKMPSCWGFLQSWFGKLCSLSEIFCLSSYRRCNVNRVDMSKQGFVLPRDMYVYNSFVDSLQPKWWPTQRCSSTSPSGATRRGASSWSSTPIQLRRLRRTSGPCALARKE